MAKPPRTAVDEEHNLIRTQTVGRCNDWIVDLSDTINFQKVVSRTERAELIGGPLQSTFTDIGGVGTSHAALLFGMLEIVGCS